MPTVLVADDEIPIVELVRFTLEDDQVRDVSAFDGATALHLASAIRPDLALLDVHMPVMSGLEVCQRLRRSRECAQTRIVMLSPLTLPIVMAREVLLFGRPPDFADYAIYFAIAFSVAWLGFAWFQGTRKGFADVL